jgi:hypothetical protein
VRHVVLVSVSYTNVEVNAPGAGPVPIPDTFARTFFDF